MNAYTQIKLFLQRKDSRQKRFSRELVENFMKEHEALRQQNAELRNRQDGIVEPVLPTINGKAYEVKTRTQIAPDPLDIDDDTLLVFKPVPVVILREVE